MQDEHFGINIVEFMVSTPSKLLQTPINQADLA